MFFNRNLDAKLLAVLLACFVWLQLRLFSDYTVNINVPVKIVNLPQELIILGDEKEAVSYQVSGTGLQILLFSLSRSFVLYNGTNLNYGKNELIILSKNIIKPKYIKVVFNEKAIKHRITILTDRNVRKTIPVTLVFDKVEVQRLFVKKNLRLIQEEVQVSGPLTLIDTIRTVYTDPIVKRDIINEQIHLNIKPYNDLVTITPQQIKILDYKKSFREKTFTYIPINYNSDKFAIFPQKISVIVRVKAEDINKISDNDIKATVDMSTLDNNKEAKLIIQVPENVKVLDYTPQKVQVMKHEEIF